MPSLPRLALAAPAAALLLSACADALYTGPVEVTRFVAPANERMGLGSGTIAVTFPEAIDNEAARSAFAAAVSAELTRLGYTVVPEGTPSDQTAAIRTSRSPVAAAPRERERPVSVGVGGQTGSFGSGVGLGVGINLGGGSEGPSANTELSVRIARGNGATLWEGRSQIATGATSRYAQIDTSARTLAAALFSDFPGGNGETVTIPVKKLQGTK